MKQFLLLFCCCLTFCISAQRTILPGSSSKMLTTTDTNNHIYFPSISSLVSEEKGIIDTVLAPVFEQNCAQNPAIFVTDRGGFVTGTNGFFDIAKLQRIIFPESYSFDLTTVRAALILDSIASTDNLLDDVKIVAKAYTDNEDGTVGDFLGDSDSIRIGDLNLNDSTFAFIDFPFSTPLAFSSTESIIVGVDFINVYDVSEGHIGIISTNSFCGNGTNAFDVFLDTLGNEVYVDFFTSWTMLNIEMYVSVVIDREVVATRNPVADYGTLASPNPAFEQLTVSFTSPNSDEMTASLISATGRVLHRQKVASGSGIRSVHWDVGELPTGLYLYQVSGPDGVETGRVIIR